MTCTGQISYVYNGENDAQNLADDSYTIAESRWRLDNVRVSVSTPHS